MEWFSQNWVWVLFAAGMFAMHLFGHGSHGGHGGHGSGRDDPAPPSKDVAHRTSEQNSNHHH